MGGKSLMANNGILRGGTNPTSSKWKHLHLARMKHCIKVDGWKGKWFLGSGSWNLCLPPIVGVWGVKAVLSCSSCSPRNTSIFYLAIILCSYRALWAYSIFQSIELKHWNITKGIQLITGGGNRSHIRTTNVIFADLERIWTISANFDSTESHKPFTAAAALFGDLSLGLIHTSCINTIQCNAMQYYKLPCNTIQCVVYYIMPYNTIHYHATSYNTIHCHAIVYLVLYYTIQCNETQYNTPRMERYHISGGKR